MEDVYIYKTGEGKYYIADDDLPIRHLPIHTSLEYKGKFKGHVGDIMGFEERKGTHISVINPDSLRKIIRTLRDSYVIESEIEYLSELEKSIV